MAYQNFINQALQDIYRKKQQQGNGQGYQGYGGYGGLMQRPAEQQQYGGMPQPLTPQPITPQTSPISEALTQQTGVNTWNWQGGEPAPSAIRTPWLGSAWHYDELGRIVPNNPNNPMAPWNRFGTTMTMDEYYESMPANSGLFAGGVKPYAT